MATHIIGKRLPAKLGAGMRATHLAVPQIRTTSAPSATGVPTLYAVVSKHLAARMQGWTKGASNNGTVYAVYDSYSKAHAMWDNGMRLYAAVVVWE